ncbi:MAG: bifunctional [glutamate--ammonia ligase]-adenylyl-L-tyrosine phosphorylase/[glutamate--ammonia-ligase] adenylyltransferase [Pseudomonadales bacterium]|nr:bifunctional [glutamate--ammonia ligase]-adenylyl-L-tyrosine phosphorylase/[glutamate--ammonia-ligase] adenylyltransferase [Pseudomonadales bacterium]
MHPFDEVSDRVAEQTAHLLADAPESIRTGFQRVCTISDYVCDQLLRNTESIKSLIDSGDLERSYGADHYRSALAGLTLENLDLALRRLRHREMVRIIYRDLMRLAPLLETTHDLSNLADACIETALDLHYRNNCEKYGTPTGADSGKPQRMVVLALGKLGARELNVSSDIDLIFFYDEPGIVDSGRDISNQEFFVRTSRDLIRSLDANGPGGFVFRVDMRLRPYGESGALILNTAAMEKYFYEQGRDWERYAFVKARPAAGDIDLGKRFLTWLIPFIYRKHLDYGAVESLREMKGMINAEVSRKDMTDDVKLGPGGIREVEFIVQALQLIWGGREARLRQRSIHIAMDELKFGEYLPVEEVDSLRVAYEFLRNTEHAIQAEKDRQTQRLPESDLSRQRLAQALGFDDWSGFYHELMQHRGRVSSIFSRFMTSNNAEREELVEGNLFWVSIWREPLSDDSLELLYESGFSDGRKLAEELQTFRTRLSDSEHQDLSIERVDRLMPVLLSLCAREKHPAQTLLRMLKVVSQIVRRSTYISYLLENLDVLKRSVHLCGMSPWVSERLAEMPILLYELSDRRTHEAEFSKALLIRDLDDQLADVEDDDLETQMDVLRQFRNGAVLKVAAFELLDVLPLMKASDALTDIAEVVLERSVNLAWRQMESRFGVPCNRDNEPCGCELALVAYGKLGGIELGYGSDLDVVMLHDADIYGRTNGEKSIENGVFYHRMAQRIIHILTRYTRFGTVYEIDLRLRPSGAKGPLVSTFSAFDRYLREDAWTWEHQALVRSRFVAGPAHLRDRFGEIRHQILSLPRDPDVLREEVVAMREKMRVQLDKGAARKPVVSQENEALDEVLISGFDLKHGVGAMVDIEFLVQYWVLASAREHPAITTWSDKVRILEDLVRAGVLTTAERERLQAAYLAYRSAVHYQWLGGEMSSFETLQQHRELVREIWLAHMGS